MTQQNISLGLCRRWLLLLFFIGFSTFVTAQGKRLIQSKAGQEALFQEGMRHYMKEDFSEAILVWESLASVVSHEPALSFYLAKAYLAEKNPKSALVHARKAHELSPYSLDYGLFFAEQLLADKQISEAINCLTKLSQYDESHPEVNLDRKSVV